MRHHTDAERALFHGLKTATYLAQMEEHDHAANVAQTAVSAFATDRNDTADQRK